MVPTDDSYYANSDIAILKGLGTTYTSSFYKKGIFTFFDLLLDFPFRFLDQTKITKIADIRPDGGFYFIDAHIAAVQNVLTRRVKMLKMMLQDDTGKIEAVFFNLYPNQIKAYTRGRRLLAFGPVKYNEYNGMVNFTQPTVTFLEEGDEVQPQERMTPVYHAVEKVPQAAIRKAVNGVLQSLHSIPLPELLPSKHNPFKLSLSEALDLCHYPYPPAQPNEKIIPEKTQSFKRISYEELIAYQLTLLSVRRKNEQHNALAIDKAQKDIDAFISSLPFELTGAQTRSYKEVQEDLSSQKPMLRLLHGDVGSGKTMVAVLAAIQVAKSGNQCVVLAPTELLAQQHYQKFSALLDPCGIRCELITSSIKGAKRKKLLEEIESGEVQVIIGTHSVYQEEVHYHKLILAIIDEQHRFGIDQRIALLKKAPADITMHQLVMTATPIPRTLQLALFSDLDVSTLDELPKGRKPIITAVMPDTRKGEVIKRLDEVCHQGTQVYWVCPNIEENEDETESVKTTFRELKKALPDLKIGLLHGQLATSEKNKVMKAFLEKEYDILVATTIIEVGVDVPNASIIVIEGAQRLGLAQLHQLRGRVGRGALDSYCILIYKSSEIEANDIAMQRLSIMRSTTDGFKIATEDLKLRGPGEVLGSKQTGFDIFRVVDVNRDFELIDIARNAALDIIHNDTETSRALITRWFPKFKV